MDQSQIEISSIVRYHITKQVIAYLIIYHNKFIKLFLDLQSPPNMAPFVDEKVSFADIFVNIDPTGLGIETNFVQKNKIHKSTSIRFLSIYHIF